MFRGVVCDFRFVCEFCDINSRLLPDGFGCGFMMHCTLKPNHSGPHQRREVDVIRDNNILHSGYVLGIRTEHVLDSD